MTSYFPFYTNFFGKESINCVERGLNEYNIQTEVLNLAELLLSEPQFVGAICTTTIEGE